ncbi:hypothetical protein EDC94DRAFT_624372 [Helicostylum pulchrum]|nr:hypothetical protein EDC94DRAFT_624372 [Helicostylum pulchrum]
MLIDPGRRDIMYCMGETSTIEKKQRLIFNKNNRSKRSRHFRILRKTTQPLVVKEAETALSKRLDRQQKRDVLLMVQETNYVQKINAVLEELQVLPSKLFFRSKR